MPHLHEARFEEISSWASDWMSRMSRVSVSDVSLRRWIQGCDCEKWSRQGLPELDQMFASGDLRYKTNKSYWAGSQLIHGEDHVLRSTPSEIYIKVLNELSERIDFGLDKLRDWLTTQPYSRPCTETDDKRIAYVAWRVFWESAPLLASLTSEDLLKQSEPVGSVFHQYFRDVAVTGEFTTPDRELINGVVLREVLHASFVYSLTIFSKNTRGLEMSPHGLSETPLPIFLVNPIGNGISVKWIQQRELSEIGQRIFASACGKA